MQSETRISYLPMPCKEFLARRLIDTILDTYPQHNNPRIPPFWAAATSFYPCFPDDEHDRHDDAVSNKAASLFQIINTVVSVCRVGVTMI